MVFCKISNRTVLIKQNKILKDFSFLLLVHINKLVTVGHGIVTAILTVRACKQRLGQKPGSTTRTWRLQV